VCSCGRVNYGRAEPPSRRPAERLGLFRIVGYRGRDNDLHLLMFADDNKGPKRPKSWTGSPVVAAIVDRVEAQMSEIRRCLVQRYSEEIIDYRALRASTLEGDVASTAMRNVEELLTDLRTGADVDDERLDRFRESAVRRLHQGISFGSLLQAYRLWGQVLWQQLLAATAQDDPIELEAALWIAGRVMVHVDILSHAVAQAYLDEAAGVWRDREVVRRDLLERLIAGRDLTEPARRQAAALSLELADPHVVVLARQPTSSVHGRQTLRATLESAKRLLVPTTGSLLVGLREDEVVAIYPVAGAEDVGNAFAQAEQLTAESAGFVVGIGRAHAYPLGIAISYGEARDALEIALTHKAARVVAFGDVLLDHIVRTMPRSDALLEETVSPLRAYDAKHNAELLKTLTVYFDNGFNMTRSATELHVSPNTVAYRLRRVQLLTGRDASAPNDLLLLMLGLKVDASGDASQNRGTPRGLGVNRGCWA